MTPLPSIKLAYGSDTTQASKWVEKKGKVMWEERKGNFNSWRTPPAFFEAWASLPTLCFLSPRFYLKHFLYPSRKTLEREGDYVQGRYWGFQVPHWRNKSLQWVGLSIKLGQKIKLKQGEQRCWLSKLVVQIQSTGFWYYNFDLLCYITYCLGMISFAALL